MRPSLTPKSVVETPIMGTKRLVVQEALGDDLVGVGVGGVVVHADHEGGVGVARAEMMTRRGAGVGWAAAASSGR